MKNEYKAQVQKAIKDMKDELNGYTWKVTSDGLVWSYLDVKFRFVERESILKVKDEHNNSFIIYLVEDSIYADYRTLEEAYYNITKATIRKANHLY